MFDLKKLRDEAEKAPLVSPYPWDLSVAVVSDVFRLASMNAPRLAFWQGATQYGPQLPEQLGYLAHLLTSTSLRKESVAALRAQAIFVAENELPRFFGATKPLTAEMIRSNSFRMEEFLRKWAWMLSAPIQGETPKESARRLEQLDYGKALSDYQSVEKTRREEAKKRAKELAEAAQREADARGWRE